MNKWLVPGVLASVCLAAVGFAGWRILHPKVHLLSEDLAEHSRLFRALANDNHPANTSDQFEALDARLGAEIAANPQAALDVLNSSNSSDDAREGAAFYLGVQRFGKAAPGLLKCTYSADRMLAGGSLQALDSLAFAKTPMPHDLKAQIEKRCEDILWKGPRLMSPAAELISDLLPEGESVALFTKIADQFGFVEPRGHSATYQLERVGGRSRDPKIATAVDKELVRIAKADSKDVKEINGLRQEARDDRARATRG